MRLRQEAAGARPTRAAMRRVAVGIRHGGARLKSNRAQMQTGAATIERNRTKREHDRHRRAWERGAWQSRRGRLCLPRFPALPDGPRACDHGRGGAVGGGGVAGLPDHASRHRPWLYRTGALPSGADLHAAGRPHGRPLRSPCRDPGLLLTAVRLHADALSLCVPRHTPHPADLCGAVLHRYGARFQRASQLGTGAAPGADGTLRERGYVGRDGLPNRQYRRPGGGRHALHSAAGALGRAASLPERRWSFCSRCSRW